MGWKYLLGKKKKKKPNLDVKEWTGCWVSQDGHSNWGGVPTGQSRDCSVVR